MKEEIKRLLREASEGKEPNKYQKIKTLLGDNIFNHSEIIDQIWGKGAKDDASKRSLFRKKLNQEEYDGTTYSFNDDEINQIASVLQGTGSTIRKVLGKKKD